MGIFIRTNLAMLRFSKGKLTQREVSQATGIGQKTLSALETGASKGIEFNTLAKLCAFFKCEPSDVLILEEEVDNSSPSKEALERADELIARGLSKAMDSPAQTPEQISARFESLLKRIPNEVGTRKKSLKD